MRLYAVRTGIIHVVDNHVDVALSEQNLWLEDDDILVFQEFYLCPVRQHTASSFRWENIKIKLA